VSRTLKFNPLKFLFLKQDSENEDLKHMPHYVTYRNIDTQCMVIYVHLGSLEGKCG